MHAFAKAGARATLAIILAAAAGAWALPAADAATAAALKNLTGLPLYPNLTRAAMDDVARTDLLGRWCNRFSADSGDSLGTVEAWYRRALVGASETDLSNDAAYARLPGLSGIKLALGIDYVTVYRTLDRPTAIELFRCSPLP